MGKLLNFDKVQKDYLSRILKGDREWFAAADENKAYISDGHFVAAMPRDMCAIKCDIPKHIRCTADVLNKMIDVNIYDFQELLDTNTTLKVDRDNIKMLKNADGEDIWINEKYAKYFSDMNIKYYGSTPRNMVYVVALGEIVGCILPINHK